jgi:hypothetical protein
VLGDPGQPIVIAAEIATGGRRPSYSMAPRMIKNAIQKTISQINVLRMSQALRRIRSCRPVSIADANLFD